MSEDMELTESHTGKRQYIVIASTLNQQFVTYGWSSWKVKGLRYLQEA